MHRKREKVPTGYSEKEPYLARSRQRNVNYPYLSAPKIMAGLGFTALSMGAWAQNLTEDAINQAFSALRNEPLLHLRLSGSITRGSNSRPILIDAFFQQEQGNRGLTKVELLELAGDDRGQWQMVNRVVGDGVNLFRYDFQTSEASSIQYGSPVGDISSDYRERFFRLFSAVPTVVEGFMPRLVKEIAGGDESTYRRWLPGRDPLLLPDRVIYQQTSPFPRSFQFEIDKDGNLIAIRRFDVKTVGDKSVTTAWTVTVMKTRVDYTPFVPYQKNELKNWRSVTWMSSAGNVSGS